MKLHSGLMDQNSWVSIVSRVPIPDEVAMPGESTQCMIRIVWLFERSSSAWGLSWNVSRLKAGCGQNCPPSKYDSG